jgi:H+-translocating NAD(P) transhydrogenase subunit alpha
MSGTNAISGITLIGALDFNKAGTARPLAIVLGVVSIVLATINVVGGFVVTNRMLHMFRKKD